MVYILYVLNSPVLSNSQFDKLINFFGKNSKIIDCTFTHDENIENSIKNHNKICFLREIRNK